MCSWEVCLEEKIETLAQDQTVLGVIRDLNSNFYQLHTIILGSENYNVPVIIRGLWMNEMYFSNPTQEAVSWQLPRSFPMTIARTPGWSGAVPNKTDEALFQKSLPKTVIYSLSLLSAISPKQSLPDSSSFLTRGHRGWWQVLGSPEWNDAPNIIHCNGCSMPLFVKKHGKVTQAPTVSIWLWK